jgi:hypothetical protein
MNHFVLILIVIFGAFVGGVVVPKKSRGNCSDVDCPYSSYCVAGRCVRLQRIPCNWENGCPPELPVCWKNFCSASKPTFLSCRNIAEVDLASREPMAIGLHKAAWAGTIGDELPIVVKGPVEQTARKRSMFRRSIIDEIEMLTTLGFSAQEWLPKYFGGCLNSEQIFPGLLIILFGCFCFDKCFFFFLWDLLRFFFFFCLFACVLFIL